MFSVLYSLLEVLVVIVPILLAVAFITIVERKQLAAMQRRVGPNAVGYYGVLQPFADALKLVAKETVVPVQAAGVLYYLAPVVMLVFTIIGWAVVPFGPGLALADLELGILYSLAVSSVGIYGVLFAGWSANSAYAFLGSLRSTAQMVSYELLLSSGTLCVIVLSGSFNLTAIVESQQAVWYIVPLLPIVVIYAVSALAELNRTPFDLPEAESELVSGYNTEHGAMPFVLFFLAEYMAILLMSSIIATLFLGGYSVPEFIVNDSFVSVAAIILAVKICVGAFAIVWVRATLPRLRWDQLLVLCWTQMLPIAIAIVLLVPSLIVAFDA